MSEKYDSFKEKVKEHPKRTGFIIAVIIVAVIIVALIITVIMLALELKDKIGAYKFNPNKNSDGHTIFTIVDKKSPDVFKKLCDAYPDCKGFNTNGEFKREIEKDEIKWLDVGDKVANPDLGLYVRS